MTSPLYAAKAYGAAVAQIAKPASALAENQVPGQSFADMLKSTVHHTAEASKNAEKQMALQTEGKANLVDVVTAISEAETSLQTMVAVRDQVLSAYTEILHMQI